MRLGQKSASKLDALQTLRAIARQGRDYAKRLECVQLAGALMIAGFNRTRGKQLHREHPRLGQGLNPRLGDGVHPAKMILTPLLNPRPIEHAAISGCT